MPDDSSALKIAKAMDGFSPAHRLTYLDGIRGAAALYVALSHCYSTIFLKHPFSGRLQALTGWLGYGHIAVCVFITLSGYCLMLPAFRPAYCRGWRNSLGFYRKRAHRIIPPYYGAVLVSLLLTAVVPGMNRVSGDLWGITLPAFTAKALISHFLLIQNFSADTIYSIDFPLWSIAVEFQIYLLFPIILLPLWRWKGNMAAIGGAVVLGVTPFLLVHPLPPTYPQLIILFALGMAAATWQFPVSSGLRPSMRIGGGMVVALIGLCGFLMWLFGRLPYAILHHPGLFDPLIGLATAALLVYGTDCVQQGRPPWVIRFFSSTGMVWLGSFSYSLYLLHAPLLTLAYFTCVPRSSPALQLAELLVLGILFSIAGAYLFYLLIERHFLPARTPSRRPIL